MRDKDRSRLQVILRYLRMTQELISELQIDEYDKVEKRNDTSLADASSTQTLEHAASTLQRAEDALENVISELEPLSIHPKRNT
jgi:hypothetical protein